MIEKLTASIKRKKTRRKTLQSILSEEQENRGVVNLHRLDKRNIGDYYCAPHHYFDSLKNTALDLFDYQDEDNAVTDNFARQVSNNALIIGGGGLLNRKSFKRQMEVAEELASKSKKVVLWGIGHNEKSASTYGNVSQYNINIGKFAIAGTRDFSMPGDYVPCVSCLHPIFDRKFETTQEVGMVFHKKTLKKDDLLSKFEKIPSSSNTTNLEDLISFIGKSEAVITDSYHAMYWSILLGKKVAVVPNSSKFFDFKYKPVFTNFENCLEDVQKATPEKGVLEESRELNHRFYDKVANYLNL